MERERESEPEHEPKPKREPKWEWKLEPKLEPEPEPEWLPDRELESEPERKLERKSKPERRTRQMRIVAVLFTLLSACSTPMPRTVPQGCFARAGFHMVVGDLRRHDCGSPPAKTILGLYEVKPGSIPCGLSRAKVEVDGIGKLALDVRISPYGISGHLILELPGCRARYEAVFLRMR